MSEIEIHHSHEHAADDLGKRIGVLVGIIGILLAAVTIASHREHTAAVIHKTEANDQWSYYQAKKIREHVLDVGATLATTLGKSSPEARDAAARMDAERDRYAKDSEGIKQEAQARETESAISERRALRFDLGEGLLELGLVLCSLYFLSRKRSFPVFGLVSAVAGLAFGLSGFLI